MGAHLGLDADTGTEIVDDSAVAVRRYFWALTLSAVVTAVLIGGAAWLLGVPLAFTIAVVTLVTSYVPYLGAIVSGAFATLIALGSNGIDTAIVILVVILVVQNIVQTIVLVRLAGNGAEPAPHRRAGRDDHRCRGRRHARGGAGLAGRRRGDPGAAQALLGTRGTGSPRRADPDPAPLAQA